MKMMNEFTSVFSFLTIGTFSVAAQPTAAPSPEAAATNAVGPRIQFATPVYDFVRARQGDPVKYTYVFTNTGDQLLIVTNVQPQCGCTAAGDWTRQVEAGKTGSIPIQFNSAGYNGPVFKQVTVTCNDKRQTVSFLQLKGTIYRPFEINPQVAVFNLPPDSEGGSMVVSITNNMEEPLTLSAPQSNNRAFTVELKTIEPGKGYQLLVSAVPPLNPGSTQGQITLKTSWTNPPVLNITVYANVQAAIGVIPAHITLPAAPLMSAQTNSVMIQNNSTNQLTLSEPAVNAPGVETQIKEVQAGRSFNAFLSFPRGFEIPAGQQVEFTVKSSNPKFPVVRVPITQYPRPVVPMAPAQPAAAATPNPLAPPPLPPVPK